MGIYEFQREDAERFARERGIKFRIRGSEMQFMRCPYCGSGNSRKDQYSFSVNLETGAYNCPRSSCGATGNMVTLARDFGFSLGRDVDEYYEHKKRYRNLRQYPAPDTRPEAVKYLEGRGISKAITEKYNITTRKDNEKIIVFPFMDENGDMQFIKYRNTDPAEKQSKEFCESNCKPILFGMNHCLPERETLVMTEGQIDSLSVAEAFAGEINAVSVPNGAKGFTWVPHCWDFLCQFKTLVVFGDYEHEHITLLDEMRTRFNGMVKHVRFKDYQGCKDANELLQKFGRKAVIDAVMNAEPVRNPKIVPLSEIQRVDVSKLERISTGIGRLDQILGGFYFGQLIILTGERGLGKSTLGSQFITRAISQHYTTFCYSGELVDWMFRDWIERQIAGPENIEAVQTESGYVAYRIDDGCAGKITEWYEDKCFWYDNGILESNGGEMPDEALIKTLENAIKQYGCRVLMIDNLMTAIEDDMQSDIYRQQTQFVKQLSVMAKHYKVIIVLIAHPRKAGSYEFKNDDIAGSSNITNLADVVMRYALPKYDEENPPEHDRILQVTKNRLSGKVTFDGIPLWFEDASKRISDRHSFSWFLGWENISGEFIQADDYDTDLPF